VGDIGEIWGDIGEMWWRYAAPAYWYGLTGLGRLGFRGRVRIRARVRVRVSVRVSVRVRVGVRAFRGRFGLL